MIALFVWIGFLAGLAINLAVLAGIDLRRLDFLDGILIGHAYFVLLPFGIFLLEGGMTVPELRLAYLPYQDLATTGMLIGGMFLLPALRALAPRVHPAQPDASDPRMAGLVIGIFLVTTLLCFALTGLGQGGHWQGNLEDAMRNPAFVPLKYAANVARNAVFAVLLWRVAMRRTTAAKAIVLGAVLAMVDLLTTFNRITAVYLLLMVLLLLKDRPLRMAAVGAASLAALSGASVLWPAFRGLATAQGYTRASFAAAWDAARASQQGAGTLDASLNAVFESSNIAVLDWIVNHFGTPERPFLGAAMVLRPLTLALPAALWPDRPQNFGLVLGEGIAHAPSLALNSTLYGECYANFGWAWPLGLAGFLLFWHCVFRWIAPRARLVQTMGAFAAIAMWRFDASFVGCAALLTGSLVPVLWLARRCGLRPKAQALRLAYRGPEIAK